MGPENLNDNISSGQKRPKMMVDVKHPGGFIISPTNNMNIVSDTEFKKILSPAEINNKKQSAIPVISPVIPESGQNKNIPQIKKQKPRAGYFFAVSFILMLTVFSSTVFYYGREMFLSAKIASADLKDAVSAAKSMDAEKTLASFEKADARIEDIRSKSEIINFIPFLSNIPQAFGSVQALSKNMISAMDKVATLQISATDWIWNDGEKLIDNLSGLKSDIDNATAGIKNIQGLMAMFGSSDSISESNSIIAKAGKARDAIDALLPLLKGEHNFIIFFANDSEMRPAGGFYGSYALININEGEIKNISVNDIYYPDRFLDTKYIPPLPLQVIAPNWQGRDANWFFDFPTSAKKVISFMEQSKIYSEKSVKFSGAVSINHKFVTDVIDIIGPIELPEYNMTLTSDNFLETIQAEVSRDSSNRGDERKNVLKSLMAEMILRVKTLDSAKKKAIMNIALSRLDNKDIEMWIDEPYLQSLIAEKGWSGESYKLPKDMFGDYLAVLDANIGSGKTDISISEKRILKSALDENGILSGALTVERTHNRKDSPVAFYSMTNRNYLRLLVPPGTELLSATGTADKKVIPSVDYIKEGYKTDPDIAALEAGMEGDKAAFSWWTVTEPGNTTTFEAKYERKITKPSNGAVFRFVYDKQSSMDVPLDYTIKAPNGYIFKESNSSEFHYYSENPPARLLIDLTLSRLM